MNGGSHWAVLVAVCHGSQRRSFEVDENRLRETRQLIARASAVTTLATTLALIAPDFLAEWQSIAKEMPHRNLFLHPADTAPAAGVMRVLRAILARDANARVILIPADHCAAIESAWVKSAKGALALIENRDDRVYLLHDQTRVEEHFSNASEELCSTTVIVGSAESLLHLSEGSRTTKVLDLMTDIEPEPAPEKPSVPVERARRPINLVHVRLVEEYARIQKGLDGRSASGVHVVA